MLFAGQAPPACILFPNLPQFLPPSAFAGLGIGFPSWEIVFSQLEKYFEALRETASFGGWNPLLGREEPFLETPEAVWHSFKSISEAVMSLFPLPKKGFSCFAERRFIFGLKSFCVWRKVVVPFAESPFAFRRKPLLLARKPFFSSKKNRSGANEMLFMGGIPDFMLNFAR